MRAGPGFLSGAPSSRWSDSDLHLLGALKGSDFEALDLTPSVTSVVPTSGAGSGATVTINGVNFSGGAGLTHVLFGGVDAGAVQVVSDTQLRVTAPTMPAGSVVDIVVVSPYGASAKTAADRFTYSAGATVAPDPFYVVGADGSLSQTDPNSGTTILSPAGTILAASSVVDGAGHANVFAITTDRRLWKNVSGAWSLLSVGSFQQISTATNRNGAAVVFGVLTDGSLLENSSLFAGGWTLLSPAATIVSVSAVTDATGNDVAYAITSDLRLWRHGPTGWALLSTGAFLSVSAGRNGTGQAVVYGVLTDHSLWENNPAFAGGWQLLSVSGSILSVSAGGADEAFAITVDHRLWDHRPASWTMLSTGYFTSISGTATAAGQSEVFGTLADGSLWEHNPAYVNAFWL